jgi:hypothetical protein
MVTYGRYLMIPDYGFNNFFPRHQKKCNCEYCSSLDVDWTKLTSTEKMVKALILKANIMAELNSSGSDLV